jgi:hypothetical protein
VRRVSWARYPAIARAHVDTAGNLRLYRAHWRVFRRQWVFHPAGEWADVILEPCGDCMVRVPLGEVER